MPGTIKHLGQDDFDWPTELYQLPDTVTPESTSIAWTAPFAPVPDSATGSTSSGWDWSSVWSGITQAVVPISQAAANIIRAVKAPSAPAVPILPTAPTTPPGYVRLPSGQLVTASQAAAMGFPTAQAGSNWLLWALLGGGALILLTRKR